MKNHWTSIWLVFYYILYIYTYIINIYGVIREKVTNFVTFGSKLDEGSDFPIFGMVTNRSITEVQVKENIT